MEGLFSWYAKRIKEHRKQKDQPIRPKRQSLRCQHQKYRLKNLVGKFLFPEAPSIYTRDRTSHSEAF